MNRITPLNNSDNSVNMQSVSVMPASTTSFNSKQPRKSFVETFRLFNKIPTNMKKAEVMQSDNFLPKFFRFLNANEYTTYDTKYSKTVIVLAVMNAVLLLTFLVFVLYYYSQHCATNIYIKKELLTEELKEKNKELDSFNNMNLANTIISGGIGGMTFVLTVLQFLYVFNKNDFR